MPFRIGMKVKCIKEPKNPYDSEAIRCEVKHLGKVGYMENYQRFADESGNKEVTDSKEL